MSYSANIVDVQTETGSLLPKETASTETSTLFVVDKSSFRLEPGKSLNIFVEANNSSKVSPGGHYGAILIRQMSADTSRQVPINQVVSVGLFLVKEDGAIRQLELSEKNKNTMWYTRQKRVEYLLKNTGNSDVTPRITTTITQGARTYAKATFNENSVPLFAGQERSYSSAFVYQKTMLPGRYTKSVAYRYDGQQDQTVIQSKFWYVPVWTFVTVFVVFFGILIVIVGSKKRRNKAN
jgi:hypothetical protein